MALKKFLMAGIVAAVLVACGDDDSSDFATRPSGDSSSACEDCDGSSSSEAKSSDSETSVSSSSSAKSSSSSVKSSSSATSSSSSLVGRIPCDINTDEDCFKDDRDGQTYKTVKIGDQWWMAENLNYAYIGVPFKYVLSTDSNLVYYSDSTSWCYDNDAANCAKYGRLYTWAAAMDSAGIIPGNTANGCGYEKDCNLGNVKVRGVCPEGWLLPSRDEWNTLLTAAGGEKIAGIMLKSTEGWNDKYDGTSGNGSDTYFFSALPAGGRYGNGGFDNEGDYAYFWSSTEDGSYYAYGMYLGYDSDIAHLSSSYKFNGFSVRCLKD